MYSYFIIRPSRGIFFIFATFYFSISFKSSTDFVVGDTISYQVRYDPEAAFAQMFTAINPILEKEAVLERKLGVILPQSNGFFGSIQLVPDQTRVSYLLSNCQLPANTEIDCVIMNVGERVLALRIKAALQIV